MGCSNKSLIKDEKIVTIKELEIHIVPNNTYFPRDFRRDTVKGCASSAGKIWIIGKEIDGKIHIDWKVFGHELQHILSYNDRDIGNPDDLM